MSKAPLEVVPSTCCLVSFAAPLHKTVKTWESMEGANEKGIFHVLPPCGKTDARGSWENVWNVPVKEASFMCYYYMAIVSQESYMLLWKKLLHVAPFTCFPPSPNLYKSWLTSTLLLAKFISFLFFQLSKFILVPIF